MAKGRPLNTRCESCHRPWEPLASAGLPCDKLEALYKKDNLIFFNGKAVSRQCGTCIKDGNCEGAVEVRPVGCGEWVGK